MNSQYIEQIDISVINKKVNLIEVISYFSMFENNYLQLIQKVFECIHKSNQENTKVVLILYLNNYLIKKVPINLLKDTFELYTNFILSITDHKLIQNILVSYKELIKNMSTPEIFSFLEKINKFDYYDFFGLINITKYFLKFLIKENEYKLFEEKITFVYGGIIKSILNGIQGTNSINSLHVGNLGIIYQIIRKINKKYFINEKMEIFKKIFNFFNPFVNEILSIFQKNKSSNFDLKNEKIYSLLLIEILKTIRLTLNIPSLSENLKYSLFNLSLNIFSDKNLCCNCFKDEEKFNLIIEGLKYYLSYIKHKNNNLFNHFDFFVIYIKQFLVITPLEEALILNESYEFIEYFSNIIENENSKEKSFLNYGVKIFNETYKIKPNEMKSDLILHFNKLIQENESSNNEICLYTLIFLLIITKKEENDASIFDKLQIIKILNFISINASKIFFLKIFYHFVLSYLIFQKILPVNNLISPLIENLIILSTSFQSQRNIIDELDIMITLRCLNKILSTIKKENNISKINEIPNLINLVNENELFSIKIINFYKEFITLCSEEINHEYLRTISENILNYIINNIENKKSNTIIENMLTIIMEMILIKKLIDQTYITKLLSRIIKQENILDYYGEALIPLIKSIIEIYNINISNIPEIETLVNLIPSYINSGDYTISISIYEYLNTLIIYNPEFIEENEDYLNLFVDLINRADEKCLQNLMIIQILLIYSDCLMESFIENIVCKCFFMLDNLFKEKKFGILFIFYLSTLFSCFINYPLLSMRILTTKNIWDQINEFFALSQQIHIEVEKIVNYTENIMFMSFQKIINNKKVYNNDLNLGKLIHIFLKQKQNEFTNDEVSIDNKEEYLYLENYINTTKIPKCNTNTKNFSRNFENNKMEIDCV